MIGERMTSIARLRRRAEAGSAIAQYELGTRYARGNGVVQNFDLASEWCRRAALQQDARLIALLCRRAEAGDADAQNSLGALHTEGMGVEKSHRRAADLWHAAARASNPRAIANLAWLYAVGLGVERNSTVAFRLHQRASRLGVALASRRLAGAYICGLGTRQCLESARHCLFTAFTQGRSNALHDLALLNAADPEGSRRR